MGTTVLLFPSKLNYFLPKLFEPFKSKFKAEIITKSDAKSKMCVPMCFSDLGLSFCVMTEDFTAV